LMRLLVMNHSSVHWAQSANAAMAAAGSNKCFGIGCNNRSRQKRDFETSRRSACTAQFGAG
jgi:hypothetical protein